jgi:lysozyme family protein
LGDSISDQLLANELFDTSVNLGTHRAVEYLQLGLNLLNRNQLNYPDISVDGKFGQNTLNTLNKYLSIDKVDFLFKIMNILQGMHYIEYMNESPAQERFCRGWLQRIQFIK